MGRTDIGWGDLTNVFRCAELTTEITLSGAIMMHFSAKAPEELKGKTAEGQCIQGLRLTVEQVTRKSGGLTSSLQSPPKDELPSKMVDLGILSTLGWPPKLLA